ncbi:MAG: EAL domain-containing protein [Hyphomicrobiaceae bacterium]|nr:EAL domain-containing protein [Hyphomicrobiaceae bacterium]
MRKPKVLVVDDDPITRAMVAKKLRTLAEVVEAENGHDALHRLEACPADLAIVDLAMPIINGIELIGRMRNNARLRHIPIIVLTANQTRDGLEEALRAGATSFLLKPLDWGIFGEHIRRVLELAQHMSLRDNLTGLPSRELLRTSIEHQLNERESGSTVAVCVVDLDNFKQVNDTLGHGTGDRLLMLVAERLKGAVRSSDTIARIGGDVFAIVQMGLKGPEGAEALARRLMECAAAPYEIDGHAINMNFKMGIATAGSEALSGSDLIRHADLALHESKREGHCRYRFYESDMDARLLARNQLARDLRRAVQRGEFELHYQPLVSLESGMVSGFESLIRWRHPERGLLQPGAFIGFSEEIGLIVPISDWVIRESCREASRWPGDLTVAVNISPAHVRDGGLLASVGAALAESGLAPCRLELEITETSVLQNTDANLATLRTLRDLGVRIAMDDFGTGYSSLSYLQRFPFDKIKIDRSFVADIGENRSALNIVRLATALAEELGIASLAEGVETAAQLEAIAAAGCKEVQGYYFSKPVPASHVPALLREWPHHPRPQTAVGTCNGKAVAAHSHSMVPGGLLVTS